MVAGTIHQVNLAAPPQTLQVAPGDRINVTAEFDYIGPAVSGAKIRAAMYSWTATDPHNEKAFTEWSFDIPESRAPGNHITVRNVVITLPTSGLPEGLRYGLYVKLYNLLGKEWYAYVGEKDPPYYQWVIDVVPAVKYTLTTKVSPSGSGSITKILDKEEYEPGEFVVISAVPAAGYYFDHWEGDASGSSASVGIRMDGARSVTAVFKPQAGGDEYFTVTFSGDPPEGGFIEPVPWLVEYKKYDVVRCESYANAGWKLDYWTVNGTIYTGIYIFVTITGNTTIIAHWKRK